MKNCAKINHNFDFVNSFNYSSLIYIYFKFQDKFKKFELNELLNNYRLDKKEKLTIKTNVILIKEILKIVDFQQILNLSIPFFYPSVPVSFNFILVNRKHKTFMRAYKSPSWVVDRERAEKSTEFVSFLGLD